MIRRLFGILDRRSPVGIFDRGSKDLGHSTENLVKSLCLFCIFTSGFIEAFEIAEIENSVPQEIASSQTWWVLFIWLIVNFVTWLTGVLGTCS